MLCRVPDKLPSVKRQAFGKELDSDTDDSLMLSPRYPAFVHMRLLACCDRAIIYAYAKNLGT
jgi:hypothetical protein